MSTFASYLPQFKLKINDLKAQKENIETLKKKYISNETYGANSNFHDITSPFNQLGERIENELTGIEALFLMEKRANNAVALMNQYRDKCHVVEKENKFLKEEMLRRDEKIKTTDLLLEECTSKIEHLTFLTSLHKDNDEQNVAVDLDFVADESRRSLPLNCTLDSLMRSGRNSLGFFGHSTIPEEQETVVLETLASQAEAASLGRSTPINSNEQNVSNSPETVENEVDDKKEFLKTRHLNWSENAERLKTFQKTTAQLLDNCRYDIALKFCEEAVRNFERECGADHLDVASALRVLANVYCEQKRFEDAITCAMRVLKIRETALGAEHVDVADVLDNIAAYCRKSNQFEEAVSFSKRALLIREKIFGKDTEEVAKQLMNLALIYSESKAFSDAADVYARVIPIYERQWDEGDQEKELKKLKMTMAGVLLKSNRLEESEKVYKDILTDNHRRLIAARASRCDNAKSTSAVVSVKSIWEVAEECESRAALPSYSESEDSKLLEYVDVKNAQTMSSIYCLSEIYRLKRMYTAANTLNDVLLRAKRESQRSNAGEMKGSVVPLPSHRTARKKSRNAPKMRNE